MQAGRGRIPAHSHVAVPICLARQLLAEFDAVVLAGGAEQPRDLPAPGRERLGIHFAMDFLTSRIAAPAGQKLPSERDILATGRHVVVIGGGDTGSDCVGTSIRQGARSVTQLEILAPAAGAGEQVAHLAELAAEATHPRLPHGGKPRVTGR